nr:class I SAM-dependent methyltransferase [Rhodococcus aetherivorans]
MPENQLDEELWDERYRSRPALWSGEPNRHLVGEAAELEPGLALDVGCGEGADAIWLARRGWRVDGVDVSGVALRRAAEHADRAGAEIAGRITWLHENLTAWDPGRGGGTTWSPRSTCTCHRNATSSFEGSRRRSLPAAPS